MHVCLPSRLVGDGASIECCATGHAEPGSPCLAAGSRRSLPSTEKSTGPSSLMPNARYRSTKNLNEDIVTLDMITCFL